MSVTKDDLEKDLFPLEDATVKAFQTKFTSKPASTPTKAPTTAKADLGFIGGIVAGVVGVGTGLWFIFRPKKHR